MQYLNGRCEPLGVVGMDLGDVAASSIKSAPTPELILCHVVPISDRASTGDDQWEAKKTQFPDAIPSFAQSFRSANGGYQQVALKA